MKGYLCKRVYEKITMDGNLDKDIWKTAEAAGLADTVTGGSPRQGTDVRLLWDDECLYVAFDCRDEEVRATYDRFNDPLYDEDVVEIFLDDNNDLKTYIELEVNPRNAVLHYMIANDLAGSFLGYARLVNNIRSAVRHNRQEKRTQYEMAIPFTEFAAAPSIPPKPGDRWRMNLYRIDRGEAGADEYTAWCPTGRVAFHMPQCFGELVFAE